MNILVLCPTYGRPTLLTNAVACFEAQDYPAENRFLLICDDAGQIKHQNGARWRVMSFPNRFRTITEKYSVMLGGVLWGSKYDAVALLDDDDPVGPQWLSSHARALESARWSYPRNVFSLHRPPSPGWGKPGTEPSAGRFWASAAVRLDLLREMGGFIQTADRDFDLQHLKKWQEIGGDPGRPDELLDDSGKPFGPQYVYGWMRSNHVSIKMKHADTWYQRHTLMEDRKVERLEPLMDDETRAIYRDTWGVTASQGQPSPLAPAAESVQSTLLPATQ